MPLFTVENDILFSSQEAVELIVGHTYNYAILPPLITPVFVYNTFLRSSF